MLSTTVLETLKASMAMSLPRATRRQHGEITSGSATPRTSYQAKGPKLTSAALALDVSKGQGR